MQVVSHSYFLRAAAEFIKENLDMTFLTNEKLLGKLAKAFTDMYLDGKNSLNVKEIDTGIDK